MMTQINATTIKELRERTLAGFSDCKKALVECDGDLDKAAEFLRKKGLVKAAKKSGRIAAAGLVHSYIHAGGRIGVLLEVNCETDFVAKTEQFQEFVKDVAMQIAAMNPQWLTQAEVPAAAEAKEREIRAAALKEEGKPDNIVPRIVDGQIKKWYAEVCLMDQPFVKDSKKSIVDLQTELVATIGENCKIRRFVRWEVGEGIEVEKKDFAQEIAELSGGASGGKA